MNSDKEPITEAARSLGEGFGKQAAKELATETREREFIPAPRLQEDDLTPRMSNGTLGMRFRRRDEEDNE